MVISPDHLKILKSKAMHLLKENDDILRYIIELEIQKISETRIEAASEFELSKKYYENQGMIKGMRHFMQKLNEWASKDI